MIEAYLMLASSGLLLVWRLMRALRDDGCAVDLLLLIAVVAMLGLLAGMDLAELPASMEGRGR